MSSTIVWDRLVLFLYTTASLTFMVAACLRLGAVPYSTNISDQASPGDYRRKTELLSVGNLLRVPAAGINILASFLSLLVDYWVIRTPSNPPKHVFDFPATLIQFLGSLCFGVGASCVLGSQSGKRVGLVDAGTILWLLGSIATFISTSLLLYVELHRTFRSTSSSPPPLLNTPLFISFCFWTGSIFFITGSSIYLARGIRGLLPAELCLIIGSTWYLLGIGTDIYFGIQNFVNTRRTKG